MLKTASLLRGRKIRDVPSAAATCTCQMTPIMCTPLLPNKYSMQCYSRLLRLRSQFPCAASDAASDAASSPATGPAADPWDSSATLASFSLTKKD